MAVYATAFFAYKFFVENVGVSVRNVSVVVITYVLVFLVWLVNRLAEKKRTESEGGENVRYSACLKRWACLLRKTNQEH